VTNHLVQEVMTRQNYVTTLGLSRRGSASPDKRLLPNQSQNYVDLKFLDSTHNTYSDRPDHI